VALEAAESEPRPMANRARELETVKEILAEVFYARSDEVEKMIKRRLRRGAGQYSLFSEPSQK
jgi:hypothetical protein